MELKHAIYTSIASVCIVHLLFSDLPRWLDDKYKYTSFSYETDSQGQMIVSGQVKHEVASTWLLVELKNVDGSHELMVVDKKGFNVLTGEFVLEIHAVDDSLVSFEEDVIYFEPFSTYLIDTEHQDFYNSLTKNIDKYKNIIPIYKQTYTSISYLNLI